MNLESKEGHCIVVNEHLNVQLSVIIMKEVVVIRTVAVELGYDF
jgi:hypothetical protein